ncbi:hypothetical protein AB0G79_04185 [Streptomyces sp. NPDC020807]|uniref:hypothetical protein n=1 Tax=Streptomyces sp. NPDC020807 TaxID=3155119 RepID=UPI0033D57B83
MKKYRETVLAVCAVAALVAGASACTSSGDGKPKGKTKPAASASASAKPCEGGTYTWSGVTRKDVLTGVSDEQELGKDGGELTHPMRELYTPHVSVTYADWVPAGARDAKAALNALGVKIGEIEPGDTGSEHAFTDVKRPAPDTKNRTSMLGPGKFVDFAWVKEVTGEFTYNCGTEASVTGKATSWTVDGSGVLTCSEPPKGAEKREEYVLEAARIACGPDAPAAKG